MPDRSGTVTRLFCWHCGSPVAQEHDSALERTFFNTGFMDDPQAYPPTARTFAGQKLGWLELHDDLPKHQKTILIATE
ncbi:MAG: GFA family protein [Rhizobiaceae bacterium]